MINLILNVYYALRIIQKIFIEHCHKSGAVLGAGGTSMKQIKVLFIVELTFYQDNKRYNNIYTLP